MSNVLSHQSSQIRRCSAAEIPRLLSPVKNRHVNVHTVISQKFNSLNITLSVSRATSYFVEFANPMYSVRMYSVASCLSHSTVTFSSDPAFRIPTESFEVNSKSKFVSYSYSYSLMYSNNMAIAHTSSPPPPRPPATRSMSPWR